MVLDERSPRLHLGCGAHVVPGWINIDGSWNARLSNSPAVRALFRLIRALPEHARDARHASGILGHDLRKPLPFRDGSVVAIYSCDLLEHLYRTEAQSLLSECRRVLAPGGVIRLIVPDLRAMVEEYLGARELWYPPEKRRPTRADLLNERLLFRPASPTRGNLAYRLYRFFTDFHDHKWMYDEESLVTLVAEADFSEVEIRGPLQSRIAGIEAIELPYKIEGGEGVCVEAIRPGATDGTQRASKGFAEVPMSSRMTRRIASES